MATTKVSSIVGGIWGIGGTQSLSLNRSADLPCLLCAMCVGGIIEYNYSGSLCCVREPMVWGNLSLSKLALGIN